MLRSKAEAVELIEVAPEIDAAQEALAKTRETW